MSVVALTACGGGDESAGDDEATGEIDYSFNCNESRGALHTYQMKAEERKAPAEVAKQSIQP